MNREMRDERKGDEKQLHEHDSGRRENRTLSEWQNLIEERLSRAIEEGVFENLPGAGKPLNLENNPNEPEDMRLSNKLLKDNNLSPPWIADRKELLRESQELRRQLRIRWQILHELAGELDEDPDALADEWERFLATWLDKVHDLNLRIRTLNLGLPIWRLEIMPLSLERELDRIGARRTLL